MARGKETELTTKLLGKIESSGVAAAWKIADPKGDYKTVARPFDCFGNWNGKFFGFEVKQFPRYAAFSVKELTEGQRQNLDWVLKTNGIALVVLFINSHGKWRLFPFDYKSLRDRGKCFTKEEMLEMPYYTDYSIEWLKEACGG